MKLFKWAYGVLALIASSVLIASFFLLGINPITQITLLIQSIGFGWICGFATGGDM